MRITKKELQAMVEEAVAKKIKKGRKSDLSQPVEEVAKALAALEKAYESTTQEERDIFDEAQIFHRSLGDIIADLRGY